ncbi:MAG: NifB/NifX family molybdenum-iron cluster-binding protein [Halothermotrichaceae bacterium]
MKIAVTASSDNGFKAEVNQRLGRAPYFAIVDVNDGDKMEKKDIKFIENDGVNAASGAGVRAAQIIADNGVEVVISGNIGPKAFSGLKAAGVKIYSVDSGTIEEAIKKYSQDNADELNDPTNNGHVGFKG